MPPKRVVTPATTKPPEETETLESPKLIPRRNALTTPSKAIDEPHPSPPSDNEQHSILGGKDVQPLVQPTIHQIVPVKTNYELIDWTGSPFSYPNMIRIYTIADGSCLFHALMNATNKVYRSERTNSFAISRIDIVKNLRKALAYRLGDPVTGASDPTDNYYSHLGGGTLKLLSRSTPQYGVLEMQSRLRNPNQHVGNEYNEFISDQLDIDIYILDGTTRDLYMTGDDWDRLYKSRDSVVLLYMPGHYELVGILTDKRTEVTLFKTEHPFIQAIRARMVELCHD
jgi:hypothetical protein